MTLSSQSPRHGLWNPLLNGTPAHRLEQVCVCTAGEEQGSAKCWSRLVLPAAQPVREELCKARSRATLLGAECRPVGPCTHCSGRAQIGTDCQGVSGSCQASSVPVSLKMGA